MSQNLQDTAELNSDSDGVPKDFEAALAELEALVIVMENGSLPLEQSFTAYKKGVELSRICQEHLTQAEQQIKVLEGELLRPLSAVMSEDELKQ